MGMGLGFVASLVTSWAYVSMYTLFITPDFFGLSVFNNILIILIAGFAVGLLAALYPLIPGTIGGGLIGLFLDQLASFRRLNKLAIIILGALFGVAVGLYMAAFVMFMMQEDAPYDILLKPHANPLLLGTIGGLVGIAQSWLLSRWIEKRTWDPGDNAGLIGLHRKKIAGLIAGSIGAGLFVLTLSADKTFDWFRFSVLLAGIAVLGGLFANWVLGALLRWRAR